MKIKACGWNKIKGFFLTGMVLIGIMLFFSYTEKVCAEESEKIRIGIYPLPGFCEMKDGKISGYQYEYLLELAEITGWKYEFVQVETYEKGILALENREIDLFSPVQKTEEGLSKYLYSDYSFGKKYKALVTDKERSDLDYETFREFNDMRVAVVRDSVYTEDFYDYAAENGFQVKYVLCDSSEEALARMHSKKADAAVVDYLEVQSCDKVLARFNQELFYYITNPENKALMETLNAAVAKFQVNKPNFLSELTNIYLPTYKIRYLTKEQREYIKQSDRIKIGYMQDAIPISYTDKETGEFAGVTRDILDELQTLSGLSFEYVPLPAGNIDYAYLKENNIVITADVAYNKWNRTMNKMAVTTPYDYMNRVFAAKRNLTFYQNKALRLAVSTGSQTLDRALLEEYPSFEQMNYPTVEEAFDAVIEGEADAVLVNQYVADYWLGRPIYSSLGIIPAEGIREDHCLAILDYSEQGKVGDYIMIKNILDVAISQLDEDMVNMIIFENTISQRYRYAWKDFMYENKVPIIMGALLLLLIMAMQIVFAAIRRRNYQILAEEDRKLAIQQRRYELIIEKTEDVIFETDLQTGTSMASEIMRDKFGWTLDDSESLTTPDEIITRWKVHKDDAEILKKSHMETRYEGKNSECVVRLLKNDMGYVWCRVKRYPIMDKKGKMVKIIGNIVNIDQMTKEAQKLRTQTRTDSMTGLLNKDTFIMETAKYLQEKSENFCMIFIDLDHFKQVNDSLGHLIGDAAIREAAKKLQISFANVDLISRFGGDEFCAFIRDIPVETIKDRLEHLRRRLSTEYYKSEQTVKITASIGAVYYHRMETNVYAVLEEADKLAYQAKCEGRNRVVFKEIT